MKDIVSAIMEGRKPREMFLSERRQAQRTWKLHDYVSELEIFAASDEMVIVIHNPSSADSVAAEAQALATKLAEYGGSISMESGDLIVDYDTIEELVAAMASLGTAPSPSDLI